MPPPRPDALRLRAGGVDEVGVAEQIAMSAEDKRKKKGLFARSGKS